MAPAPAETLALLDMVGPILCRFGHRRVNLTWDRDLECYMIDGRDDGDRGFFGYGDTPSEAVRHAERSSALRTTGISIDG